MQCHNLKTHVTWCIYLATCVTCCIASQHNRLLRISNRTKLEGIGTNMPDINKTHSYGSQTNFEIPFWRWKLSGTQIKIFYAPSQFVVMYFLHWSSAHIVGITLVNKLFTPWYKLQRDKRMSRKLTFLCPVWNPFAMNTILLPER
jgi:hypothetical protein